MLSIVLCSLIWLVGVLTQPYLYKALNTLRKLGVSWPTIGSDDRLHVLEVASQKTDLPRLDGRSKLILKLFIALHSIFVASGTMLSSEGHVGWVIIVLGLVFISLDMGSLWRNTQNPSLVLKFAMPVSFLSWPVALLVIECIKTEGYSDENVNTHFVELLGWSSVATFLTILLEAPERQRVILRNVSLGLLVVMGMIQMAAAGLRRNPWFDVNEIRQLFLVIPTVLAWHTLLPMVSEYVSSAHAAGRLQEVNVRLQATVETFQKEAGFLHKKASHVSVLAHEVRTPLNAVLSACTLLQDTGLNADQAEYLRLINTCLAQISNNINFVLDMAKMEAGLLKLDAQPFSINRVCTEALSMVRSLAESKGVELRLDCSKSIGLVRGDAARLSQALQNLLTNSIKFTNRGSVTLVASVTHPGFGLIDSPTNTALVRFEVIDTGIGMSPEQQDKLFQPFVQAQDERTQSQYGGSGLGLVITRQIIELMGGTVTIDPTRTSVGVGSTFVIDVPLPSLLVGCASSLIEAPSHAIRGSASLGAFDRQIYGLSSLITSPSHVAGFPFQSLAPSNLELLGHLALDGGTPLPEIQLTNPNLVDLVRARSADNTDDEVDQKSSQQTPSPQRQDSYLTSREASATSVPNRTSIDDFPVSRSRSPPSEAPHHQRANKRRSPLVVAASAPGLALDSVTSSMRVLLVEDNILSGALMVRILESIGFGHVEHVTDAHAALENLKSSEPIHVIVTDLHLAGAMDGIQLTTHIRSTLKYASVSSSSAPTTVPDPLTPLVGSSASIERGSSTRRFSTPSLRLPLIIGLSGDCDEKTPSLCKQVGMDAFLVKPVTRDRISDVILSLLGLPQKPHPGGFRGGSGASTVSASAKNWVRSTSQNVI